MRAPTAEELATMPKPKISIHVIAGYVWEQDVDEMGYASGPLRPHYAEGASGYPEGGYPDSKDLPKIMAETAARERAEKK